MRNDPRKPVNKAANYINHIALVIDASASMYRFTSDVIRVADGLIQHLARRSRELDQETRVSVYTFSSTVECVIFDKDVLRLPSINQYYHPNGQTALIDATIKSQDDLGQTAQLYGDHAFLTYVITDGEENASVKWVDVDLRLMLQTQQENWTTAVLVPNASAIFEAKRFGFPADNIAIWDTRSVDGLTEVGEVIRKATDSFMTSRASGIRGTRALFSTSPDAVNSKTIRAAKLKPLAKGAYQLLDVDQVAPIREWCTDKGVEYRLGIAYYQLTKTESIQPQKNIAVVARISGKVYTGAGARQLLGLGGDEVRVRPDHNDFYDIFVQSTSVNRKLVPGTKLLIVP